MAFRHRRICEAAPPRRGKPWQARAGQARPYVDSRENAWLKPGATKGRVRYIVPLHRQKGTMLLDWEGP